MLSRFFWHLKDTSLIIFISNLSFVSNGIEIYNVVCFDLKVALIITHRIYFISIFRMIQCGCPLNHNNFAKKIFHNGFRSWHSQYHSDIWMNNVTSSYRYTGLHNNISSIELSLYSCYSGFPVVVWREISIQYISFRMPTNLFKYSIRINECTKC